MGMKRILILVEGQTEEKFVKDIMNPIFDTKGLFLTPIIIRTKEVKAGPNFKGGVNSYTTIKKDVNRLLKDSDAVAVTTMFDFYGLPRDFPAWESNGSCYDRVQSAEKSFALDIDHKKFIPYLQLHEFEGLLFSAPKIISDTLDRTKEKTIQSIRDDFSTPEEINEGVDTHPSKRLLKHFPRYNKPVFGSLIAGRTGMERIRNACPHFNEWISKLLLQQ